MAELTIFEWTLIITFGLIVLIPFVIITWIHLKQKLD